MSPRRRLSLALPVGFALLWASTYATAQIGLREISPLLFVAIRLAAAASIMAAGVFVSMRVSMSGVQTPRLLIGGALVHGVTLGAAHVALVTVKAAPMALVHAFHPALTAAIGAVLLNERFTARQWFGMILGFAGVALAFPSTALQLVGGVITSCLAVWLLETPLVQWTPSLQSMLAWNIVMLSIAGMAIYTHMLSRGQAGHAASALFIVPGSAAIMAWFLLDEALSTIALVGLAIATIGMWIVWRPERLPNPASR
jgi:drug/metabolite transporter (DMT)-like permease